MNREHKKMVTWIDYEHDPNRVPKPNTLIHMIVDYEVCIGYYDVKLGFQMFPLECDIFNHFIAKSVTPTLWAYPPKHPFET
jgi:hypothetical protein